MSHPIPQYEGRKPPEFQFSLLAILVLTTAVAGLCAVLFGMPAKYASPIILCLMLIIPALATVVVVYGRGYQRAFCIGVLFPSCAAIIMFAFVWGIYIFQIIVLGGGFGPIAFMKKSDAIPMSEWIDIFEAMYRVHQPCMTAIWVVGIVAGVFCVLVYWMLSIRKTPKHP